MSVNSRRFTIGTLLLVGLLLLVCFDTIVSLFSWLATAFGGAINVVENITQENAGPFQEFANFLKSTWSWLAFIFTTPIALAVLIFISMLYEAFESRWR